VYEQKENTKSTSNQYTKDKS